MVDQGTPNTCNEWLGLEGKLQTLWGFFFCLTYFSLVEMDLIKYDIFHLYISQLILVFLNKNYELWIKLSDVTCFHSDNGVLASNLISIAIVLSYFYLFFNLVPFHFFSDFCKVQRSLTRICAKVLHLDWRPVTQESGWGGAVPFLLGRTNNFMKKAHKKSFHMFGGLI